MKVQIKELSEKIDSNICYMPKEIFDALELPKETQYKIHFGQIYEYYFVLPSDRYDECMYFPSSVMKKIQLYKDLKLNIWRKEDDIYLGPVVGVFVNPKHIAAIKKGKPSFSVKKHVEAGNKTNCLCYYFSFDEIDWNKKMIKGYTIVAGSNIWVQDWFPIPNVIYDRGINFKKEDLPLIRYMKQEFKNNNVHFINSKKYLSKWKVYECLSKYTDTNNHLPKTIIYNSFDDVLLMLKKYKFVFIKASGGTHGKQVLSLEQVNNRYKLNYYEHSLKEVTLDQIEDVENLVKKFVIGRKFVVQQGIRLVKYDDRIMDIRLLMIKDGQGNWETVQCHSRVAKANYTITNFSLGGDWIEYEKAYPKLSSPFCTKSFPDKNELSKVTKKILYYIERELGSFGEIGMDMAIDIYGNIWFIEANSRPEKLSKESLYDPVEIPPQALYIFEYAKFLVKS